MQPKISIIIPIYNSEKYLKECLDSVINQTLRDIEIFCVVNGSTDSSLAVTKAYAAADNRVTVIEKEEADLGGARNSGIRRASGEYLMFVDSDDWIKLEACEKLYEIAKEHDLDILQGEYEHVPNMLFKHFKCKQALYNHKISGLKFWNLNKNTTMVNWDKLWKRDFFIKNELYNYEGIYFEDVITSLKGYIYADSFMFSDFHFYYYRRRHDSIMNSKISQKHIDSSYSKLCQIENFIIGTEYQEVPGIAGFYFVQLFVHFAVYNRKNISDLKNRIKNIKIGALDPLPLRIKLAYNAPRLASVVYPLWKKRGLFKFLILNFFSPHKDDIISCRQSPERDSLYSL